MLEKLSGWARRLPWNWAAFHENIIQGLQLIVNWRLGDSRLNLRFLPIACRSVGCEEGNWDAPECGAMARDIEDSSRAVGRCILAGR